MGSASPPVTCKRNDIREMHHCNEDIKKREGKDRITPNFQIPEPFAGLTRRDSQDEKRTEEEPVVLICRRQ